MRLSKQGTESLLQRRYGSGSRSCEVGGDLASDFGIHALGLRQVGSPSGPSAREVNQALCPSQPSGRPSRRLHVGTLGGPSDFRQDPRVTVSASQKTIRSVVVSEALCLRVELQLAVRSPRDVA